MLVVLDGFGLGDGGPADATALAHAPFFARARRELPMAQIETSGEAVGLPPGQMGNSEVGHMTLGAGRIIDMDMTRISKRSPTAAPRTNPVLQRRFAARAASGGGSTCSGSSPTAACTATRPTSRRCSRTARERGVRPVVHAFLDGRDTPPRSRARLPRARCCRTSRPRAAASRP